MYSKRGRKAQVTLFVILAIVIVGIVLAVYFLIPKNPRSPVIENFNPGTYITDCIKDDIDRYVENLSLQGGYMNPEAYPEQYYTFLETRIQYLCYTDDEENPCIFQKPQLIQDIESQLTNRLKSKITSCLNSFKANTENKVNLLTICTQSQLNQEVHLYLKKIVLNITCPIKIETKSNQRLEFNQFLVEKESPLYEQATLAKQIVNEEISGNAINFFADYASRNQDFLLTLDNRFTSIRLYNITAANLLNSEGNPLTFLFTVKNPKYI
jgi:hypothetical protein